VQKIPWNKRKENSTEPVKRALQLRLKRQNWRIIYFLEYKNATHYFAPGELAEWSIAAVLKTVDCNRSGGSNPSLSAKQMFPPDGGIFV
jgi:hypothetical protein